MFEDSLFASKVLVRPARSRWAAVVAVLVQATAVAGLLVAPLLRPLALPMKVTSPAVVNVNLHKPEPKIEPVKVHTVASSETAARIPAAPAAPVIQARGGGRIATPGAGTETSPVLFAMGPAMGPGMGSGSGTAIDFGAGSAASPVVRAKSNAPVRISSGVSSGMLLGAIRPVYPAIARMARVEGTVVVSARIDKAGHIVGLQVTSGPEMLRSAAVEAVREARYRPYLLNGEATEVETTIVVNFRLGG